MAADAGWVVGFSMCILVPAIFVASYAYLRNNQSTKASLRPHEYALLLAMGLQIVFCSLSAVTTVELHKYRAAPGSNRIPAKVGFTTTLAYIATIWCIKIAVNLLYMHVSRSTRYHKWTLWSLIFICVAGLIVFFHEIFGIWPLADRFAQGLVAGSINAKRVRIRCSSYVINMVTNIILFVQPFVVIKTVRNRALRGGLYFVFGLALVDIAMSIVPIVLMFKSLDQDRDTMMIILCAQTAIGIMIATTPGLARPVLRVLTRWGQNNLSSELLHFTDDLEPHGLGELDPPLPTDGQEFVTSAVPEVAGIVSDKEKECHIKSFADLFACMKSRLARLLARKPKLPVYNRKSSQAGETTDGSVC